MVVCLLLCLAIALTELCVHGVHGVFIMTEMRVGGQVCVFNYELK